VKPASHIVVMFTIAYTASRWSPKRTTCRNVLAVGDGVFAVTPFSVFRVSMCRTLSHANVAEKQKHARTPTQLVSSADVASLRRHASCR